MQRSCDFCGTAYEAKRSSSRFCGSTCRARKSTGAVVPMRPPPEVPAPDRPSLAESVRAELRAADAESSGLGVSALLLAERIDSGQDPGSSLAALNRELRATLAEATRGQVRSGLATLRDELAERRARA